MKKLIKAIYKRIFSAKQRDFIELKLFRPKYLKGNTKDIFEHIYVSNVWGSSESFSGTGSELSKTRDLINYLNKLTHAYNIRNIFDVPCGDFNWMQRVNLDGIKYTGGDIVDKMIEENNKQYRKENIEFVSWNLITDKIETSYDMVINRDCFVHLSFNDIQRSLNNIIDSGTKYLLTTSFVKTKENLDMSTGGRWRPINLSLPPFNFPKAIEFFEETNAEIGWEGNKTMSLYLIADLKKYVVSANK
jgi:hypothetical protein